MERSKHALALVAPLAEPRSNARFLASEVDDKFNQVNASLFSIEYYANMVFTI